MRQTLGVERVRAGQPVGGGRVHWGHAGAAGRVVVIVGRIRGLPIASGYCQLLHCHHRSAVWRFAWAPAPTTRHKLTMIYDLLRIISNECIVTCILIIV